ncbi:ubiquitin-like protein ISG15 [Dromiciops gliroides]|uniref:ubiquitin-like protein ISG15 n=1 Tax=Dromiciops gliroides TaxID=33562 RepID=UPI001CC5BFF6|nr:ubiquitin-like protein ISG15 [Dromiciops gliroides]
MSLHLNVKTTGVFPAKEGTVKAGYNTTVLDLKKEIAKKFSVPAYRQRLTTKGGELLLNWKCLSEHKLNTGDTLLLVDQDQSLDILVRNGTHTSSYRIQLSQTVAQLTKMVQDRELIRGNQFWLCFEEQNMQDNDHLGDYALSPLCTIQMNLKLPGGVTGTGGLGLTG